MDALHACERLDRVGTDAAAAAGGGGGGGHDSCAGGAGCAGGGGGVWTGPALGLLGPSAMKEMVGGCCVCSDERGWAENPLVYCDGHGCSVAVHQACYGIVHVPTGPWFCRKCESQERAARVRCELCPHKDGALKRTDNGGWAHVVCALYIPEVQFANVSTMEPIVLQYVPHDRYNKTCYLCEEQGRESKAATGACMTCNKHGCRQAFHVTCAQMAGLLCEEEGVGADNVKYCGYCKYHYSKMKGRPAGRSAFDAGLGEAASHSQEKHERDKKKNREKEKQKRHKRVGEPSPLLPSLTVTTEKVRSHAIDVPVHSGTGSEGSEGKCQDGKKKKLPHGSGQKGKKGGSGAVKSVSLVQSAQELLGYVDLNTHKDGYAPASGLKGSGQGSGATRDGPKAMDGACQDPTAAPSKAALGGSAAPPPPPPPPPSLCAPAPTASPPRLYEKAYEHSSPPKLYEKAYEEYVMSGFSTVAGKRSHPCSSGKDESGPGWENKRKASKKAKPSVGLARAAAASVGGPGGAPPPAAAASSIAGAATCPGGGAVGGGAAGPPALDGLATGGGVGGGGGGGGGRAGGAGRPDALPTSSRLSSSSNSSSASSVASSTSSACGSSAKSPSSQRNGSFHSMRAASASPPGSCSHSPPPPGLPASGMGMGPGPAGLEAAQQPTPTSIEQLLERQLNEGQHFLIEQAAPPDVIGYLRGLHRLQTENRRLEEQIRMLTARRERLMLLSSQLALPLGHAAMPTLTPAQGAACMPTGMLVHPQGPGSSNSIPSLVVQQSPQQQQQQQQQGLGMQQSLSLQQHNTVGMPSMSVQQQQHQGAGLTGVQQQVAAGVGAMQGGAGRMLSGLPGSQISINGLVGALNSVVQTPAAAPMGQNSSPNHPTLGLSMPSSLGNSISGLALLQDQQRQILMHQQQSFHQLLGDQLFTQDPQQLMYHLMQQQQHQQQHQQQQQQHQQHQQQGPSNAASHEQHLAGGPSCTLPPLGGTPVPVSAPGQANPFLSLHSDQAALKKRSERGTPGSGDGS
ncbi:unnamed protein product [Lampetra fluviatilis]